MIGRVTRRGSKRRGLLGADLEANEAQIREIGEILESIPSVKAAREQLQADFDRQRAEDIAKQRDDAQLALDLERKRADRELADARATLNAVKTQAEQTISETELALKVLIKDAARTIIENIVVRRLLDVAQQPNPKANGIRATEILPPLLGSLEEVSEHIVSVSNLRGEDSFLACSLSGVLAGSQLVLLAGLRAASLAQTIAYSLGGGGSCIVPIAPTIFSLGDLLNAPAAPVGEIPCYAGSLGQFLMEAMQQGHLSVVILQGVNRAPRRMCFLTWRIARWARVAAVGCAGGIRAVKSEGAD